MAKRKVKSTKKLTVIVPEELLERALKASEKSIVATVMQGLELIAARNAYKQIRLLRGKVKTSLNVDALREDA